MANLNFFPKNLKFFLKNLKFSFSVASAGYALT